MMIGETPAAPPTPLWPFPATQERVRACLEAADDAAMAGFYALADRLVQAARWEVHTLRAHIGGNA